MTQKYLNLACGLRDEIAALESRLAVIDWHLKTSKANEGANASEIRVCNSADICKRFFVPNDIFPVSEFLEEYRKRVASLLEKAQAEFDSL